ncbi:hypothetical protein ACIZ62_10180 [Acetobacterium carbinolicum]|uniref:hypothetical protein n=1 Tax=Acetobacterium carbinolicum TaxID=52690 RepID=UPI0039BFF723
MNILLNSLDNLNIGDRSFEFIPDEIKKDINIEGVIVGANGKFIVNKMNVMALIKKTNLKNQIGVNMYNALLRKPMMVYLMPTIEEEFVWSKNECDEKYGIKAIHLNNFAQAFSIGSWFIKDSCISATNIYWLNLFNTYNSQTKRDMAVTLSNGSIAEKFLTAEEVKEAIERMYEVYSCLLPDESKMGHINCTSSRGTTVWEIDKAISKEGNSFSRGLILLQEARRTGELTSKIDKYCSILECLYAINKQHKTNISHITAVYIGKNNEERGKIINYMKEAFGIRSDSSHGDNLKYLKENNCESLKNLSTIVDDYVRRVFRKIISEKELNYDLTPEKKANTRKYFQTLKQSIYPD